MPRDSSGEDLGGFRPIGAAAGNIAAQVAEAQIRHAEAEGNYQKAERFCQLWREYEARHGRAA